MVIQPTEVLVYCNVMRYLIIALAILAPLEVFAYTRETVDAKWNMSLPLVESRFSEITWPFTDPAVSDSGTTDSLPIDNGGDQTYEPEEEQETALNTTAACAVLSNKPFRPLAALRQSASPPARILHYG